MNLSQHIAHPIFHQLREAAIELGLPCYAIGGYVRDVLLERPCKDIDIVVEGKGITLAKAFAKQMGIAKKQVVVYKNFGTALVRTGEYEVEFVGARKESYQRHSRKPIVEDGSLKDDQLRRDFTINALSISLNTKDWGELHDPFGGLQDLQSRLIRTPTTPGITFSDDPLRMMRAIRFATQLQFSIGANTWAGILEMRKRIRIVSQERISTELNKIIAAEKPSIGLMMLYDSGLLEIIFPELHAMQGVETVNGISHKDNFYHTLQVLDNVVEKSNDLWLRWVAILHDIAKPQTKRFAAKGGWTFHGHEDRGGRMVPKIFRRMKLPLDEKMRYVQKLVRLHQRPIALVTEGVTDSAIRRIVVEAGEDLGDLLDFCRADITSRNEAKVRRYIRNYDALEQRIYEVQERDNLRNWQPPVDGQMIMQAFDIPPSKIVGLIKNDIREAILDGVIPNEEEAALAYMYKIAPRYLES